MDTLENPPYPVLWRLPEKAWPKLAALAALVVFLFYDSWGRVVVNWYTTEEYSHGFFIPVIALFLIWQHKNEIAALEFQGSAAGLGLLLLGLLLYLVGQLSALDIIVQYSLVLVLMGIPWALAGGRVFRHMWVGLLFLAFAIPLPEFLLRGLSAKLQLLSSQLGVYFIRLFNVSVYLEGNVIDLGSYQLQVAEACSGLNYLFPLMSVAFMCAYFFQAPLWQRAVVFLSSMPLTLVMNSLRIGMIGVLTDRYGKSMAEGFLHDFEGWFVFMACTGILVGEMWVLVRIGKEPRPLMEVFGLTLPDPYPAGAEFRERRLGGHYWAAAGLLLLAAGLGHSIERREEIVPARAGFAEFPLQLGEWQGRREILDKVYLDALKLSDHFLGDFARPGGASPVNFYAAYYNSQRKGASIHSPRSCLPGGGWLIDSLETVAVDLGGGKAAHVNRALIKKGEDRQLVYYWFQQRGRDLTNEYLVKWYLLWDAIFMNRTDGALVRLTTAVPRTENLQAADQRLADFLRAASPRLNRFVPD